MLMRGAEANRYMARPDPSRAALLIYGADPMRIALKRQEAIAALLGPNGESEMRLTRLSGAELRKDPSRLIDSIKEIGFFSGARVVFVEEATDGLTATFAEALKLWQAGDANIIVTAGDLKKASPLKTLFEKHLQTVCIALYNDPPTREEIETELKRAGLAQITPEAMADLTVLARAIDPGDFRQTLQKIALYKWQDASPLTPAEVAAMAPATIEAELDQLLAVVANKTPDKIAGLMRRLDAQGTKPVTICIQSLRHFRSLQTAMTDSGGLQAGLAKARVFGPRREQMQRQAQLWGQSGLETAIAHLLETDLALRSSSKAPAMALVERALMRISMIRR